MQMVLKSEYVTNTLRAMDAIKRGVTVVKNDRVRIGFQIRPQISLRLCPAVGPSIPWLVMLLYKLVKQARIKDIRHSWKANKQNCDIHTNGWTD